MEDLYKKYLDASGVCTDTRHITSGVIFFALKGPSFDGNTFALQALENGASVVVVDSAEYKIATDTRIVWVQDVLTALQNLAHYHRLQCQIPVIGLTGSNGKTTTKELIKSMLSQSKRTYATAGNLNNHIGVPITILSMPRDTEVAIVEMGANHKGEIAQLCEIAQPTIGLITNIGKSHLEGFGGEEGVKMGKGELFNFIASHQGTAFINQAHQVVEEVAQRFSFKETVTYGASDKSDVVGQAFCVEDSVRVNWVSSKFGVKELQESTSHLTGLYNSDNIRCAIALGLYFGLEAGQITKGIESYIPQNMRSQVKNTDRNKLILDTYNANPSSVSVALHNLSEIEADSKVAILGDMFELGEYALAEHQEVVNQALRLNLQQLFLVGNAYKMCQLPSILPFTVIQFETTEDAKKHLALQKLNKQLILVKGSRGMKLEQLINVL